MTGKWFSLNNAHMAWLCGEKTHMRVPKIFNLRSDTFEEAEASALFDKWTADHVFVPVPIQGVVTRCLESIKGFLIRQKGASFRFESGSGPGGRRFKSSLPDQS
jgi:hypothetical protein